MTIIGILLWATGITIFFDNYPVGNADKNGQKFERFFKDLLEQFVKVMKDEENGKYALHVVVPTDVFGRAGTLDYEFLNGLIAETRKDNIEFSLFVFLAGNEPDAGGDALAEDVRGMIRKIAPLPGDQEEQGAKGDCYARGLSCRDFLNTIVPVFIWNAESTADKEKEIKRAGRRLEVASYDFGGVGLSAPPRLEDEVDSNAAEMYRLLKRSYGACDKSLGEVCSTLVRPNQKWFFLSFDLLLALSLIALAIRWLTCWLEPYRMEFAGIMWSLVGALALIAVLLNCLSRDYLLLPLYMVILVAASLLLVLFGMLKTARAIMARKRRADK